VLLLFLGGTAASTLAANFTVTLDRDTIMLGDSAVLSLNFQGGQPDKIPDLPAVSNLRFISQGQSSQFTFANGVSSSTISYNFAVTAKLPGDYEIPAISAVVDGQTVKSPVLRLRVAKPAAASAEAVAAGTEAAFMKLSLPKNEVYVGEVLTAELQIYVREGVQTVGGGFQITAQPAEGFTLGKMLEGQHQRVRAGNANYTKVPFQVALTAIKSGPITVGPITARLVIQVPSARRRDPFLDPFGMFAEQKHLTLATDTESAKSLAVPLENAPADFNGAVGNFQLSVSAGPTNIATGDPITVRVEISGRGALESLALPEQKAWHDFKTYPPTANVEFADQLGIQGRKVFEQIVSPENTDVKQLPPFSFSFFDPEARQYRTLTQPAVKLSVRPGGVVTAPTITAPKNGDNSPPPPAQDIVPIKQRLGTLAQVGPPLFQQTWFVTAQAIPVLAFVGAFIWRRRTDALANNPRLRRQRHVARVVSDGLGQLRHLATEKKSDEFFALVFRLIQEQIGERLDLPATAITEAVVDERLTSRVVAESTRSVLQDLFQTCNAARYAPIKTSQELAALIPRLEGVLKELQEVKL
jgi:hypothetical protein